MSDTGTAILDLAEEFIRTKGFHSFSYRDIAVVLKIKNAAIHYYFPSKTDLGIAVIERAIQSFEKNVQKWQNLPEVQQFERFTRFYTESYKKGWVCLMGALSASYETYPEKIQLKIKQMGSSILKWLEQCLENGRKKGMFDFKGPAADKALVLVSNLLSSLLLSRVMQGKVFNSIQKQVLQSL